MAKKRTNYSHKLLGRKTSDAGFTILELMISSSVFAVVLLVIAVGVINFTNTYYKGIISTETQSVARTIMADISQAVEFGGTVTTPNNGVSEICIDNTLYAYVVGQQVTNSPASGSSDQGYNGLIASNTGCPSSDPANDPAPYLKSGGAGSPGVPPGARELLSQYMRLGFLSVTPTPDAGGLYTVQVRVLYGDDDLFNQTTNWATALCSGGPGSQFCAVSNLTTTVEKRLI